MTGTRAWVHNTCSQVHHNSQRHWGSRPRPVRAPWRRPGRSLQVSDAKNSAHFHHAGSRRRSPTGPRLRPHLRVPLRSTSHCCAQIRSTGGGGGNRTHVRGTSIAGFSVCSRLFHLASGSVSWQPPSRPARKFSVTAVGRDGDPARLTSSLSDQRAEPRERRGYLSSQSVVVIGSCNCLHPFYERMTLDTLPTTEIVPRQTQYAPGFDNRLHFNTLLFLFSAGQPPRLHSGKKENWVDEFLLR